MNYFVNSVNSVNNLFGFGTDSSAPHYPQVDLPCLNAINWKTSVVAGSYALKAYTGDTHWDASDVDIMVACPTKAHFLHEAQQFETTSRATLIKSAWFDGQPNGANKADELFHEKVLGSRTYTLPNYNKTVQLICLKQTAGEGPEEILSETSDIPACVSFKMYKDQRIFYVPQKGLGILATRKGSHLMVCPNRMEKYKQRGYTFY